PAVAIAAAAAGLAAATVALAGLASAIAAAGLCLWTTSFAGYHHADLAWAYLLIVVAIAATGTVSAGRGIRATFAIPARGTAPRGQRALRKSHCDIQAALGARAGAQRGTVGVGDRPDDGQAEPVSPVVANPLGAELPEWLEQMLDRIRGDERAGVSDRYGGAAAGHCRRDRYPAAGGVLPDGVVDEVGDQALRQARVGGRRGRAERGAEADAVALGFVLAVPDRFPGDLGEVHGLGLPEPALAAGEGEQRRDEAPLPIP